MAFEVVAWCGFEVSEDLLEVKIVGFVVFQFLECLEGVRSLD